MQTFYLKRKQTLPVDPETAWAFFSNPSNLRLITPPWLDFSITCRLPDTIYAGLIITYRIRPVVGMGVPWVSEITQVQPPGFFVDEQRHGPFSFWHHQHHLQEIPGGTRIKDEVHYRLPLGPLGILVHTFSVRRKLEAIFDYRYHVCRDIFGPELIRE